MNHLFRYFTILLIFGFLLVPKCELYAQQIETVDFLRVAATITPDAENKSIRGSVDYSFQMLQDADSVYLDAHQMQILNFDGIASVKADDDRIWLLDNFKSGKTYSVSFDYEVEPKQTFYFMVDGKSMWTQGQGKYTSYWLPSLDDTNDKIEFDIGVKAPLYVTVIANGELIGIDEEANAQTWKFDMEHPMSSYLAAVAIGDYDKIELVSNSGVPLELYYNPKDADKAEYTYRHSKEIFDFLESEIGVKYPWKVYKQVPVRDFLYAGMENTSATFFSEAFMVDAIGFNDRNYINVNAHELAHQWFGNMVTAESDEHHWLQEGFATYYALLAEKEIFGEDYFYWQLYQNAEQLQAMSEEGKGESLLNPKAGSLTFYQKGAWALHILKEFVGEVDFKKAVRNYLETYAFKTATTEDFLDEVKAVSKLDLSDFEKNWLRQSAFRAEEAYQSLKKSTFLQRYFEVAALRSASLESKKAVLEKAINDSNEFISQEAVYQLALEPVSETLELYAQALESDNLYTRQAVALSLESIPEPLLSRYEDLLNDASHVTREAVLYQIWAQYPHKRIAVLEKMKGQIGFQNKNIRQLWLALTMLTDSYEEANKSIHLQELRGYTYPEYSFEIREQALNYSNELRIWDKNSLRSLMNATTHPSWRFAKSSRDLLRRVVADENYLSILKSLEDDLTESERKILTSTINP